MTPVDAWMRAADQTLGPCVCRLDDEQRELRERHYRVWRCGFWPHDALKVGPLSISWFVSDGYWRLAAFFWFRIRLFDNFPIWRRQPAIAIRYVQGWDIVAGNGVSI